MSLSKKRKILLGVILLTSLLILAVFYGLAALFPSTEVELAAQPEQTQQDLSAELEDFTINEPDDTSGEIQTKDDQNKTAVQAPEQQAEQSSYIQCDSDCTLAAVDKQNSLPSTYAPSTVSLNLTGGGQMVASAANDLKDMFAAAQAEGISLEVISSYRSYAQQQSTFEYWVSQEMAKGLSRAQAEAEANTYSAKPGHSEHQLGTTVDLKCAGCGSFDAADNVAVYAFIEENAHKYGFAVSYPEGMESQTGYVYEPWHIRWIGKDLAGQLYSKGYLSGSGDYLAQYLSVQ